MKKETKSIEQKQPEPIDFLKYYVEPHKKKSREVTEKDLKRVIEDGHIMFNLCYIKRNKYSGAEAIAHPQINNKDPLRFFITKDQKLVVNPVIIRHTQVTIDSEEGCLSYPDEKPVLVQRWNKCDVEYYTVEDNRYSKKDNEPIVLRLSEKKTVSLSGKEAKVWQHECQHLGLLGDKHYIY